jgi:hypothetical protein
MRWLSWLYSSMWSNMWAPSMWTLFGIGLSHFHIRKHVNLKHDELHKKLSDLKGDQ